MTLAIHETAKSTHPHAHDTPGHIHEMYYGLPRHLADQATIEEVLLPCADALAGSTKDYDQNLTGWMYAESSLNFDASDPYTRILLAHESTHHWKSAYEKAYQRDEQSATYSPDDVPSMSLLHAETNLAVSDLILGIAEGDVTKEQRLATYSKLLHIAARGQNAYQHFMNIRSNNANGSPYSGFINEINAMLIINRLMSTSLLALPSLPRSDEGSLYRRDTHDIQVLHTHWGEIRHVQPVEVKLTPQQHHYERYKAAIVGGSVHLYPDNNKDPAWLTQLLIEEYRGVAEAHDIRTLDAITNRVVHAIRHGYHQTPQCQNTETCEWYGLERNTHHQKEV